MRIVARLISSAILCAVAACGRPGPAFKDATAEALPAPAKDAGAVVLFDADGDGRPDLFAGGLFINKGDGSFRGADSGLPAGPFAAAVAADFDNDGRVDLLTGSSRGLSLYRNRGGGVFADAAARSGLPGRRLSAGAARAADFANSGVLDLFIPGAAGGPLFKGKGNGTFSAKASGIGRLDAAGPAAVSDIDNDHDADILVPLADGSLRFYRNDREQGFQDDSAAAGLAGVKGARAVLVDDFDNDRFRDILVLPTGCAPNRLFARKGYGPFQEASPARGDLGAGGTAAAALDFDNDGNQDLLVIGACAPRSGGVLLLRNKGDGTFRDAAARMDVPGLEADPAVDFALADYDGDGGVDVFLLRRSGAVTALRNAAGKAGHWLGVSPQGAQGSSKDGFEAKVEVKAGDLWVERELAGAVAGASQAPAPLHFGLGRRAKADMVRATWPTGIRQALADVPAGQVVAVKEKGLKSSCPFLFAWDGGSFRFVSDFLGAGFIGILTGPETYYKPDPDEYLRLESGLLKPHDGKYQLSIVEALEEVDYFDQVRLVAVDHEAGVEVHPNERLMMSPPFPEDKVLAVRNARPPVRAVDDRGNDILPRLSRRDRVFADGFDLTPYMGYTRRHSITLDLGDVGREGRPVVLLLNGYLRYWTSNSAYQASQDGLRLEPPSVEVRDRAGRWVRAVPDMGLPAGLPKTIAAELTGRFLSDDRSIRITTNMEVYWDQIRVADQAAAPASVRATSLTPSRAELRRHGYPRMTTPDGRPPFEYDFADAEPFSGWRRQGGDYTEFGDVAPLAAGIDDKFVIMGHGERLDLSFDAGRLPDLPPGWERDFFVYVDGYVKEMNPHTAYLETVEPLPFRAMSNYPYRKDEAYPSDADHEAYRKRSNRRKVAAAPGPSA